MNLSPVPPATRSRARPTAPRPDPCDAAAPVAKELDLAIEGLQPVQLVGISVAGEQTVVQAPGLSVCFDVGLCPRACLAAQTVALSHGHVDHMGGLMYYFAQRHGKHRGAGRVACHPSLEGPIRRIMTACIEMEGRPTNFYIHPMREDDEIDLHDGRRLRAFETQHTVPSLGFIVLDAPPSPEEQGKPLVCYTGDTSWGPHFQREDVQRAKVLITECTYFDAQARSRAHRHGHLHLRDIPSLLELVDAEHVVLTHLPRELTPERGRKMLDHVIPERHRERVVLLMGE